MKRIAPRLLGSLALLLFVGACDKCGDFKINNPFDPKVCADIRPGR
jgi:hypothetical protein